MQQSFEAIYENGLIRPMQPIPGLTEGQRISVTLSDVPDAESMRKESEFLEELAKEGFLDQQRWSHEPPPAHFQPLPPSGTPLSQIILQDRE